MVPPCNSLVVCLKLMKTRDPATTKRCEVEAAAGCEVSPSLAPPERVLLYDGEDEEESSEIDDVTVDVDDDLDDDDDVKEELITMTTTTTLLAKLKMWICKARNLLSS